jgi:hypothetical protein
MAYGFVDAHAREDGASDLITDLAVVHEGIDKAVLRDKVFTSGIPLRPSLTDREATRRCPRPAPTSMGHHEFDQWFETAGAGQTARAA